MIAVASCVQRRFFNRPVILVLYAALQTINVSAEDGSAFSVYQKAAPSVVMIETYPLVFRGNEPVRGPRPVVQGSGVVIDKDTVISNCHVLTTGVYWTVSHGDRKYDAASILHVDPERDLCAIAVIGLKAPTVEQRIGLPAIGTRVYSIGTPKGLELTIAEGIVSGIRKELDGVVIQTSAQISPGSSGGGLFDESGGLVGITTFQIKGGNDLNFALPTAWISELPERSKVYRAKQEVLVGKYFIPCFKANRAYKSDVAASIGRKWTEEDPFAALAWSCLAEAIVQSDFEAAVRAYERAIELSPDAQAYTALVNAYGLKIFKLTVDQASVPAGYYDSAVEAFSSAVTIDSQYVDAWLEIAHASRVIGKLEEAAVYGKRAVELDGTSDAAWSVLADTYRLLGRTKAAIDASQKAISIDPNNWEAWTVLEDAADKIGDRNLANYAREHSEAIAKKIVEDSRGTTR